MTSVRELAAWPLDPNEHRPAHPDSIAAAQQLLAQREPYVQQDPHLAQETAALAADFAQQASRPDLLAEMRSLDWSLGVIDLRHLLAFQRRLIFPDRPTPQPPPTANDWPALLALTFAQPRTPLFDLHTTPNTLTITSTDPNLQLRLTHTSTPIELHTGSPFFEAARYHHRWFLRDGYHRAYTLLQAGIFAVPAVIVHARTLEELGATQPWFFPPEVLFSTHPPRLTDFLDDRLVLHYHRSALHKTFRITIEESLTPHTQGATS